MKDFAADLTALQTAELSGLNRNTVNRFYRALRERIHTACEAQRPLFGVVEVDESLFGAKRIKGKRGRGAYAKTTVFGIFERDGQVYTEVVSDYKKATLQGIIRGKVVLHRSSTPMDGVAIMALLTWDMAIIGLIIQKTSSPEAMFILMVLKASGVWQKLGYQSSRACPSIPFICI